MFHVVQIADSDPHAVEVVKSFPTRDEALHAAQKAQQEDCTDYFEYLVSTNPDALVIDDENSI